jgi:hypothetical protein
MEMTTTILRENSLHMTPRMTSSDRRLDDALAQLQSVLIEGETIEAWAVQVRIFALTHRRILIAATSGRFIALARNLFSGFDMADLRWQDLKDAKLRVGIFGSNLTLAASTISDLAGGYSAPRFLAYDGFIKDQARQVYRLCQAHEQAWREKRRIRELEEMRAQSGGIQLAPGAVGSGFTGSPAPDATDPLTRLQQAKQMLGAKLISDAEYEAIKARVIGNI